MLIVFGMIGLVWIAVSISGDGKQTAVQPVLDPAGLVENSDELPPVTEGDGQTGEILPPDSEPPSAEADITQDDITFPSQ